MGMEKTFFVLNEMQTANIIGRYAIGGAVAAFFYIEPGTTFDLDVFIAWEPGAGGLLDFGPIYSYLMARGYQPEREAIMIEGWAVQFLPPGSALTKEALEAAQPVTVGETPIHIFTKEHLMAICLETGRPKDIARLVQFVQEGEPDMDQFLGILNRHGLRGKWQNFQARFDASL
ncbi:MAG: hypothetical protein NTZ46_08480 [Verrucomicrobia bacterium]|nr:hypothetical protein [Verrucomicrobiota bacterium]